MTTGHHVYIACRGHHHDAPCVDNGGGFGLKAFFVLCLSSPASPAEFRKFMFLNFSAQFQQFSELLVCYFSRAASPHLTLTL